MALTTMFLGKSAMNYDKTTVDDAAAAVYQAMLPRVWYRPSDLRQVTGININTVRACLHRLSRGGVCEVVTERINKQRRACFMTKQALLI